jgi:cell division protein FtsL
VLWLVLVAFVGFGMFKVKYEVMDLEDELARTNRAIVADQDAIHVLKAEWAYLSQPSRLAELSKRHLDLVPLGTAQLGQINAIPLRPTAVPLAGAAPATPAPPAPPMPASKPPIAKPLVATTSLATTTVANAKMRIEP